MNKILLFTLFIFISCITPIHAIKQKKFAFDLFTTNYQSTTKFKSSDVKPYKVTIQMGGSFLNLQYNAGDTPSFDFTPPAGIKIETVFNNGVDVTNQLVDNVYTLAPITENVLLVITTSIDNTTGLQNPEQQFKIYTSTKRITIKDLQAGQNIEIFDLTGKLIYSDKSNGQTLTINLDKSGIYVARINKRSYKLVL